MKVAIPIWNSRISPLFDTACRVLIWSIEGGSDGEWEEHDLQGLIPPMKVRKIKELGADVLICGAVSNPVAYLVESAGIELVPWISGPVDEVIEAFHTGDLDMPRYFMPGCRRRGRGRRGRGAPGDMRTGLGRVPGTAGQGRAGIERGHRGGTGSPSKGRPKKKGETL